MRHTLYVSGQHECARYLNRLKLLPCPHCKATGFLNRHGFLRGYGPDGTYQAFHGWRVFCSNRNRKGGCGKTFCVLPAWRLYRRVVDAGLVWDFLIGLLDGSSIQKAWNAVASAFCPQSGYKLWASFLRNQSHIRACLHRLFEPSAVPLPPALQLISHLKSAFKGSLCPVASFQLSCQRAFLPR